MIPQQDDFKRIKRVVQVSTSTYIPLPVLGEDAFLSCEEHDHGSVYRIDRDTWILAYDSFLGSEKITTTMKVSEHGLNVTTIGASHHRLTLPHDDVGSYQFFYGGMSRRMMAYLHELKYEMPTHERADGFILFRYTLWTEDSDETVFEFGRAVNLS